MLSRNTEYKCIRFKGKHGVINLMVPFREPTQQEINDLHAAIAEIIVHNNWKNNKNREK